jgi:hypothetical protein
LKNEKGYINAKIQIIDKKEQVKGYESPEDEADGWSTTAPEPKAPEPMGDGTKAEPNPIVEPFSNSLNPNAVDDLPF